MSDKKLTPVEDIKEQSRYLRGTIAEGLEDPITGSLAADDTQLTKFHGIYQQTARELDAERKKQKLEPLYSFMVRVRVPGGFSTAEQWLVMDSLSNKYANGTLKLTTRQAFQFHGVLKRNLKNHIREINDTLLDTIAACGDVNRNVMATANYSLSKVHEEAFEYAKLISAHLTPQTRSYHEIWLNDELAYGGEREEESEPIYGKTYLPRKFKIAIAVPPDNDTDVYTNDIGLVAIAEKGRLTGFNLIAGGGMGNTLEDSRTFPRLGDLIGYYPKNTIITVIEEIVKIQRDHGSREDRKTARLKYTITRLGLDWFKAELEKRSGVKAEPAKPFEFNSNSDRYGWIKGEDNRWYFTLFVENGRVKNTQEHSMKKALQEIAQTGLCDFRLTGNQNVIIGNIEEPNKGRIESILRKYRINTENQFSPIRLNSLACVALNTCTHAHAHAETYLPGLIDKIEILLKEFNLEEQPINIRMTGCPNGCARPYNAEIGFVGRAQGIYNMYLGGNQKGTRLNILYKEMLKEVDILIELSALFDRYSKERTNGEHFGDFIIRKGIVYISEF